MGDFLLLLSGNEIPYPAAGLVVHNPTLKEIAYLGEEDFFTGYQMLIISKNVLIEEDKINLEKLTNFDILIAILRERNAVMQKNRNCVKQILELIIPGYEVSFTTDKIVFKNDSEEKFLNKDNFDNFQILLKTMFSFGDEEGVPQDFNPDGRLAAKIAEKLKKRHQILAAQGKGDSQDIIGRYASILSIGASVPLTEIFNYTLYQLFDQLKRYQLYAGYDIYLKAKMAGAKDLEDPEDWMKSFHSKKK